MDHHRGLLLKAEIAQRVCLGLLSLLWSLVESLVWVGVEKEREEEEEEAGQRRLRVALTWIWTQLQRIGALGV